MVTKKVKDLSLNQFVLNYKHNKTFPMLERAYNGIVFLIGSNPRQANLVWEMSKSKFPEILANYDYALIEY